MRYYSCYCYIVLTVRESEIEESEDTVALNDRHVCRLFTADTCALFELVLSLFIEFFLLSFLLYLSKLSMSCMLDANDPTAV